MSKLCLILNALVSLHPCISCFPEFEPHRRSRTPARTSGRRGRARTPPRRRPSRSCACSRRTVRTRRSRSGSARCRRLKARRETRDVMWRASTHTHTHTHTHGHTDTDTHTHTHTHAHTTQSSVACSRNDSCSERHFRQPPENLKLANRLCQLSQSNSKEKINLCQCAILGGENLQSLFQLTFAVKQKQSHQAERTTDGVAGVQGDGVGEARLARLLVPRRSLRGVPGAGRAGLPVPVPVPPGRALLHCNSTQLIN